MNLDFCHLHCHSIYSCLDGIIRIPELVDHVKASGMSSVALTDHGVLYGIIDLYKACKKAGIRPLIGVEAYVTVDPDDKTEDKTRDNDHMILLVQNQKGFENLCWLINQGNLHNFYYKPRIWDKNLETHSEGLIATSACIGGVVAQFCSVDEGNKTYSDPDMKALKRAKYLSEIFQGRFYLELQESKDMWQQKAFNHWAIDAAKNENIPLVITADAHYLKEQDYHTHALVMASQLGKNLDEYLGEDHMKYGCGYYVRTPEEMLLAAKTVNAEQAFWNTTEIAKQCNLDFVLDQPELPNFDIHSEPDFGEFLCWKQHH